MAHRLSRNELANTRQTIKQYYDQAQELSTKINNLKELRSQATEGHVIADFDQTITELLAEHGTVRHLCAEIESKNSPMHALPSELLSLVMEAHVRANHHSPWALIAVSRHWRAVCMSTPQLWSKIHVQISVPWKTDARSFSPNFPHGLVCDNQTGLGVAIARSAAVPLEVTLELGHDPLNTQLLDILCGQAGYRWQHAHIIAPHTPLSFIGAWKKLEVSLPNLHTIGFSQSCDQPMIRLLLSTIHTTSPNLHTIRVDTGLFFSCLHDFQGQFKSVKYLALQGQVALSEGAATRAAWGKLPRVEILVLRNQDFSPFSNAPPFLEALRALSAIGLRLDGLPNVCDRLKCLTHVYLASVHPLDTEFEPNSIHLAGVTHLTLINPTYAPLRWFSLPLLEYLELRGSTMGKADANDEIELIWNPETFGKAPSPSRVFHFEPRANDAYILAAFRFLDGLENLYLYLDSLPPHDSKVLASLAVVPKRKIVAGGPPALKKWRSPTCPGLQKLVLICKSGLQRDAGLVAEMLDKIYRARLGTGSELGRPTLLTGIKTCVDNKAALLLQYNH
ncbi:hypothetical protein FRC14_000817 [Serendipita sp. 396]|nr:hypothetical protein FRC14_000817 [Serendipita sp. 396]KAG8822137.1 hypothetical protein FRC18_011087 [Serendipita sp. 400]KAG8857503.1 hypothetical protein FRB91_011314 [Serendipita sp. 411]